MLPDSPDNPCVSPEYSEFIKEYDQFLQYSIQFSKINVAIKALQEKNTQVLILYQQAMEAHLAAVNACIRLNAAYERLVQKYWDSVYWRH